MDVIGWPCCLCLCVRPPFTLFNHLTDFNESWYEQCANRDSPNVPLFLFRTWSNNKDSGKPSLAMRLVSVVVRTYFDESIQYRIK
jgi:hypothetical protein